MQFLIFRPSLQWWCLLPCLLLVFLTIPVGTTVAEGNHLVGAAGILDSQTRAITIVANEFGILFYAAYLGMMCKRCAKRKLHKLEVAYQHKFAEFEVNPQPFFYKVLRNATQEFNESTKIGQGGFGTVYKGMLSNGIEIAIKKLEPKIAAQGDVDDFLNEVVFITKMKHRNLVNLKGYW